MKLPEPKAKSKMPLEEILERRRSIRRFTSERLNWEQISQLLWAAQGTIDKRYWRRTAPSAGGICPLETYVVTKAGVYRYRSEKHEVDQVSADDLRAQLRRAALDEESIEGAPVSIVLAAVYQPTEERYGQRGARYVHMEAGHVAQNIHLQAVALGLASAPIGAFYDDQVQKVLSLPKAQQPLYIIPVGYPAE